MANFKTIKETKEEMQKTAQRMLEDLGEVYQRVKNIAEGDDPENEIKAERYYKTPDAWNVNFNGLVDRVENGLGLLWEYRCDINTLEGQGQANDRKSHEFLSENLEDER